MADMFNNLGKKQEIFKARLYFLSAFICSFIFYYFMTRISSDHKDFFFGRVIVGLLGLCGLFVTYILPDNFKRIRFFRPEGIARINKKTQRRIAGFFERVFWRVIYEKENW